MSPEDVAFIGAAAGPGWLMLGYLVGRWVERHSNPHGHRDRNRTRGRGA